MYTSSFEGANDAENVHSKHMQCNTEESPQAAQTLFVIYIRDSIALRFEPFKRVYENGSKIALNSTCSKGFRSRPRDDDSKLINLGGSRIIFRYSVVIFQLFAQLAG